jgi:alkanesulfonate monooxygenase SsuD/methylene tetrahydromethanopterin reductase-like flavin-dependent oxidoreductase (luciferase family)
MPAAMRRITCKWRRPPSGGKFDLIFLADSLAIRESDLRAEGRWPQYVAYFEPLTLLSAMAAVTSRIGLVSTASTSYSEPYNLARWFALSTISAADAPVGTW